MHTLGHETVGNGHPIAPAVNDFTVGCPYIVVIAIGEQDKSCRSEDIVNVVIEASVFGDDSVLGLRRRGSGLRCCVGIGGGGRIGHPAVPIEVIHGGREKTVGNGRPIPAVLDRCAGGAEVVVMPIIVDKTGLRNEYALAAEVRASVILIGAGVPIHPYAVFIGNIEDIGIPDLEYSCHRIGV